MDKKKYFLKAENLNIPQSVPATLQKHSNSDFLMSKQRNATLVLESRKTLSRCSSIITLEMSTDTQSKPQNPVLLIT
jgi:hypothetical protein